ncbi:DUF5980 family protein [Streptomyces xinghaiensis]|uniref:DUF5980 family protein n=1 Tax=Streptomyces xinghaiensis TaxID=1038928 RepID=UPI002E1464C0|nr:DUF5980 family protein [Streptomyces xinghaiensis]
MKKTSTRGIGLSLGLFSALTLTLVSGAPASASAPTWTLEADQQRICVDAQSGWSLTYAFSPVAGSWSSPITTGVRDLPPGSSSPYNETIAPGSNFRGPDDRNALTVNSFVWMKLAPAPAGDYTAEIWATDGKRTETDPLLLAYRDRCPG